MEIINNIHNCYDLHFINNQLKKIKPDVKEENLYKKIIESIYNFDKKQIFNYVKLSLSIIKNKKYNHIEELHSSANELLENIKILKINNDAETLKYDIKNLNVSLEEFESYYYKFLDPNYKKLLYCNNIISKLIQANILNYSKTICDNIVSYIKNIYKLNKFFAAQLVAKKSKYLYKCGIDIFSKSWEFIDLAFETNNLFTIYILVIKLRKILIDEYEDPLLKKYLYYNIDIELIKNELQFCDTSKNYLLQSINIFRTLFNLNTNDIPELRIIYHDLSSMYLTFSINSKQIDFSKYKYDTLNIKLQLV